jgi:hypothetical protein
MTTDGMLFALTSSLIRRGIGMTKASLLKLRDAFLFLKTRIKRMTANNTNRFIRNIRFHSCNSSMTGGEDGKGQRVCVEDGEGE